MSIFTIILLLFAGLLFYQCKSGDCTSENIFNIITNLIKKIAGYLFDILTYAIKRFTEIKWTKENPKSY